jgi:hypothetical protein
MMYKKGQEGKENAILLLTSYLFLLILSLPVHSVKFLFMIEFRPQGKDAGMVKLTLLKPENTNMST